MSIAAAKREIAAVCRRLYERGLIAGQDGNVSVRVGEDRVLVTPAGMSKVDVRPGDLVELSLRGEQRHGSRAPSSEVGMHLAIYARRPDVGAVVHAHPPTATGFAVAGEPLMAPVLPEVILTLGELALVPYATPGTPELAERLQPYVRAHNVFLLANHGATTCGPTLLIAHQRMESLEHAARILLAARAVGRVNTLSDIDTRALIEARDRAACAIPPEWPRAAGRRRSE